MKEIMIREEKKWREKNFWVFEQERIENERQKLALEDVPQRLKLLDQARPKDRLALTNYQSTTGLFFTPDNSSKEKQDEERQKELKIEKIDYSNTRFPE